MILHKNLFEIGNYFGTIPITNNNKKLSVNNNCQLKGFKNIYIIDGSVLDFKINKYLKNQLLWTKTVILYA